MDTTLSENRIWAIVSLIAVLLLIVYVYAVYAVYAVHAISSLDTGSPLRHRTQNMQRRRDAPGSCRAHSPALHVGRRGRVRCGRRRRRRLCCLCNMLARHWSPPKTPHTTCNAVGHAACQDGAHAKGWHSTATATATAQHSYSYSYSYSYSCSYSYSSAAQQPPPPPPPPLQTGDVGPARARLPARLPQHHHPPPRRLQRRLIRGVLHPPRRPLALGAAPAGRVVVLGRLLLPRALEPFLQPLD